MFGWFYGLYMVKKCSLVVCRLYSCVQVQVISLLVVLVVVYSECGWFMCWFLENGGVVELLQIELLEVYIRCCMLWWWYSLSMLMKLIRLLLMQVCGFFSEQCMLVCVVRWIIVVGFILLNSVVRFCWLVRFRVCRLSVGYSVVMWLCLICGLQ